MFDNFRFYKCPAAKRHIKKFDTADRSRTLFPINFTDHTPGRGLIPSHVARPCEIFAWLHDNRIEDWFVTTTFLFPEIGWKRSKFGRNGRMLLQETMLISVGPIDASLVAVGRTDIVALPAEWWRLFEDETFIPHPLYPEFETCKIGLVRHNGKIIDAAGDTSLNLGRALGGFTSRRTIRQLAEDSWSEKSLFQTSLFT